MFQGFGELALASTKSDMDSFQDAVEGDQLNGNEQLFAAKYLTYLPTEEELRREIEQQKEFFRLQHKD